MFAVVSYQGQQYTFEPGKEYAIDLVEAPENKEFTFSDVLLIGDDKKTVVGTPTVKGASVVAEVTGETKGDKVRIFKFHAKKRYKRTQGHRQQYSTVVIKAINHNEK